MTTLKSSYPVPVEELLPKAQGFTAELGRVPSRNQLMAQFRIGARKASQLREQLIEPGSGPDEQFTTDSAETQPVQLHLVTEPGPEEPTETAPEAETGPTERPRPEQAEPAAQVDSSADEKVVVSEGFAQDTVDGSPPAHHPRQSTANGRPMAVWPLFLLALPAFVAIWSGWVGLGELTGFGLVHPLPGIADGFAINTAITLPIGVETYAAYALKAWLSSDVPGRARRFAKYSALGSLALGALGQVAYHLMTATGMTAAPWPITALVACLPVAVLGAGAALTHLITTGGKA